eukprot:TRINITY_DN18063_c0_g1_i1.p1 TRINITY_DN18063_c0_g1~~TRINITY_DN18063_c0_g1_i1.p1  ORF type:complete len:285 (+),score=82.20 TRINITY_DN18063_c0_g1_i1:103-957(+)
MPVSLHIALLQSGNVSISAEASETVREVKARVAALSGADTSTFTLSFEGEGLDDATQIGAHAFKDGSVLCMEVDKKKKAVLKLEGMGLGDGDVWSLCRSLEADEEAKDSWYKEVLQLMVDAELYNEDSTERMLIITVKRGMCGCVEWMLDQGLVDVNQSPHRSETALHIAVLEGNTVMATLLLKYGAETTNPSSESLLSEAAAAGDERMVRLLLEHNADPDQQCSEGTTPLHYAAISGYEAIARLLLDYNADLSIGDEDGYTAHSWAEMKGHSGVIAVLDEFST